MRYGKERKQETRRRILQTAGRRFKRDGIDGSGIATLMSDAGLTNGAFYAHFASKEDLVATTVADQLHAQRASFRPLPPGRAGVEQLKDLEVYRDIAPPEGYSITTEIDGLDPHRRRGRLQPVPSLRTLRWWSDRPGLRRGTPAPGAQPRRRRAGHGLHRRAQPNVRMGRVRPRADTAARRGDEGIHAIADRGRSRTPRAKRATTALDGEPSGRHSGVHRRGAPLPGGTRRLSPVSDAGVLLHG
jgi:AcrR family transcriptional regulator